MSDMIPLSVPSIKGNEWNYVKECLDTEWVSSAGKYVERFETDIARYTGARHAIACVNGTAALQISLHIAGVHPNDDVIVPTITFIAPVNAVRYLHANPVFMDSDRYYNIDVDKTIEFIKTETEFRAGVTYNKKSGNKISAIVPVHIFGNAVQFEALISLCRERNIAVVEDATEGVGTIYNTGEYKGTHVGTIGALGCLSFNGNKIITCGGGGMILTNDAALADKARYLTTQAKDDDVRYIHNEVGYNFRLTNVQAAIGVAQLEQLPKYLEIKKKNYQTYKKKIDGIAGLVLADVTPYADVNYWMYELQIDKNVYGMDREAVMSMLTSKKIQSRPVWFLNHLQKPYLQCQSYKIETALSLLEKTLSIPCSVNLTDEQIARIIDTLNRQ